MCHCRKIKEKLVAEQMEFRYRTATQGKAEDNANHRSLKSLPYRIIRSVHYIAVSLIFICLLCVSSAEARDARQNVLILNSYHRGNYWSDEIMEAIEDEFDKANLGAELRFEYMDTKRYKPEQIFTHLKELYQHKYQGLRFDVIICSDNNALSFLLQYGNELFPDVPAVFCGVENFDDSMLQGQEAITGVVEQEHRTSMVELGLALHPSVSQLVIISDQRSKKFSRWEDLTKQVPKFDRPIKLVNFSLVDLTMDELLEKVDQLGAESIVFIESSFKDRQAAVYTLKESASLIRQKCKAPIYVFTRAWLGHGVVGGKVVSPALQGRAASRMAIRILRSHPFSL